MDKDIIVQIDQPAGLKLTAGDVSVDAASVREAALAADPSYTDDIDRLTAQLLELGDETLVVIQSDPQASCMRLGVQVGALSPEVVAASAERMLTVRHRKEKQSIEWVKYFGTFVLGGLVTWIVTELSQ